MTRIVAPTPIAISTTKLTARVIWSHLWLLLCRYQTAIAYTRHWPTMTAMVPAKDRGMSERGCVAVSCHTHAMGSVGEICRVMSFRTNTPDTQDSARFTNMRNSRSQRSTQSRLKSWYSASRAAECVAVEMDDSIQMRKKW